MQLSLTLEELQLLANVVEENRYALTHAKDGSLPGSAQRAQELNEILGKVIEKHPTFSADELLTLADMLRVLETELNQQLATHPNPAMARKLEQYRFALQRLEDKIVQSCAMF